MSDRIGVSPGLVLQSTEIEEDFRNGSSTVYTYKGSRVEVDAGRLLHRARGAARINRRPAGDGDWELRVSYPYGERNDGGISDPPQNVHELEVIEAQVASEQSLRLRSLLSDALISAVLGVVFDFERGEFAPSFADPRPATVQAEEKLNSLTGSNVTALNYFRQRAYRKTDSFIEYRTLYRRSITAATFRQTQASYIGVGKIWTTAEVENFEGVAGSGWFRLEPDMQWLKSKPNVVAVWGGKVQISYSYTEFKAASALLYEPYGSAVLLDA